MCFRCYITESPHTSIFTFTWRCPSVGNICESFLWHSEQSRKLLFAHYRANKMSRRVLTPALGVLRLFFFFYLVWWHLTLITPKHPDIVPIIPFPRHSCQVRASLNESEHTLDRMSLKVSLAFLPRCVYHFGTNRTQKKPYRPIISRQATMQWLGTSEVRERERKTKKG